MPGSKRWQNFDDPSDHQPPFATEWPLCFAIGQIQQSAPVAAQDVEYLRKVAPKRAREFKTGRQMARAALLANGCPTPTVARGEDRAPIWPEGYTGSISHSNIYAMAVSAKREEILGVGIDIEQLGRLGENLHSAVFTAAERQKYAGAVGTDWPEKIFSAKESVYKAINPLAGRFIGFQEAEIELHSNGTQFNARYVGDFAPNALMNRGVGYVSLRNNHVLTVFVVPPESCAND